MASVPTATYRLQFNPQFTFQNAIDIVAYLAELNISHIYTSPYLQPAKNSLHGYDVADQTKVNQELGGDEAQQEFYKTITAKGLQQIIDIVPNHMAAKCPDNSWWANVLKYGQISPYANYFDIFDLSEKILLPVLGEQYEKELAARRIQLRYQHGIFTLTYFDHEFPLTLFSLMPILLKIAAHSESKSFKAIINEINTVPKTYSALQILEQKLILELQKLENSSAIPKAFQDVARRKRKRAAEHTEGYVSSEPSLQQSHSLKGEGYIIQQIIKEINLSPEQLGALLEVQNYRLVFWRVSNKTLSYRRFFHINSFVGLRIENEEVFNAVHNLLSQWLKMGQVGGLRIDHIDGLRDPWEYLVRLRKLAPATWIVVEKILLGDEVLAKDWPIAGTTGYDFMNSVMGLFIDAANENLFTDFYANVIGGETDYYAILREKKLLVLNQILGGDVNFLVKLFSEVCHQYQICHDFTFDKIKTAILEFIACFPIYRTYIRAPQQKITEYDKKIIIATVKKAKKYNGKLVPDVIDFLKAILLLQITGAKESEFVMRFQQLTSPAMAKGQEDTAFYCFNRFVALNEVGGDPSIFGTSIAAFHQTMQNKAKQQPYSMLATSTHDTKRSEDVRMRLVLLSEIPEAWFKLVQKWLAHNEKNYAAIVPDRNTQYFLYQNLVGAWPIAKDRILTFMEKAVREAKEYTSWSYPNSDYEQKLHKFITAILADKEFLTSLEVFIEPLIKFGRINSLAQTAIKLTAPGIPDFYQSSEVWSFNFVDPDNRRPVDLAANYNLFKKMQTLSLEEIMAEMNTGLPKLWLIYKTLGLRKKYPELFTANNYLPLSLVGTKTNHGIAFLRGETVLTFVPRLLITLQDNWENTWLEIPAGNWRNILTAEKFKGGKIMLSAIVQKFPVAILVKENIVI
jgi:(1->4)-alpha-D-glucan 1-alpha-D-glucosylmutase